MISGIGISSEHPDELGNHEKNVSSMVPKADALKIDALRTALSAGLIGYPSGFYGGWMVAQGKHLLDPKNTNGVLAVNLVGTLVQSIMHEIAAKMAVDLQARKIPEQPMGPGLQNYAKSKLTDDFPFYSFAALYTLIEAPVAAAMIRAGCSKMQVLAARFVTHMVAGVMASMITSVTGKLLRMHLQNGILEAQSPLLAREVCAALKNQLPRPFSDSARRASAMGKFLGLAAAMVLIHTIGAQIDQATQEPGKSAEEQAADSLMMKEAIANVIFISGWMVRRELRQIWLALERCLALFFSCCFRKERQQAESVKDPESKPVPVESQYPQERGDVVLDIVPHIHLRDVDVSGRRLGEGWSEGWSVAEENISVRRVAESDPRNETSNMVLAAIRCAARDSRFDWLGAESYSAEFATALSAHLGALGLRGEPDFIEVVQSMALRDASSLATLLIGRLSRDPKPGGRPSAGGW